jgi:signal transduction histidine kinase
MEANKQNIPMLELMLRPAFCVSGGRITRINQAAAPYLLQEGDEIASMLATGAEEYQSFTDGCLYLTLNIGSQKLGANVIALENCHLFMLEQTNEKAELQALALAAKDLREPLTGMMMNAAHFLPHADADPVHLAQFNKRLYQMMRIISNMSDAALFTQASPDRMEYIEVCSYLEELLQKTAEQLLSADIHLRYSLPNENICILADGAKLERAVYNLIANAAKHTPAGGSIQVTLVNRGRLYLSVTDQGPGIASGVKSSVFDRYLRTPSITDMQEGIGLGMVLVRAVATLHGGTVLIDHPQGCGTRVTMTMELRQNSTLQFRSPILQIDYAGERDHGLQELSEVLPASEYAPEKLH